MFDLLLFNLRVQRLQIGVGEWITFLQGIQQGLVVDLAGLYHFGRAILIQSETQFDAWDQAFEATFAGVQLDPEFSDQLLQWLADAKNAEGPEVELASAAAGPEGVPALPGLEPPPEPPETVAEDAAAASLAFQRLIPALA